MIKAFIELRRWLQMLQIDASTVKVTVEFRSPIDKARAEQSLLSEVATGERDNYYLRQRLPFATIAGIPMALVSSPLPPPEIVTFSKPPRFGC